MKVGLHLPQWGPLATRNAVLAAARAIEDCGLDSAWVADHIVYPSKGGEHFMTGHTIVVDGGQIAW